MSTDKIIHIKGAAGAQLKKRRRGNPTRQACRPNRPVRFSGKSPLAFDTIYADGQRRYVETPVLLCPPVFGPDGQARCGLHRRAVAGHFHRPEDDLPQNPRSTVGTVTEIYDYLRLLYARIGIPHCPVCGREIKPADAWTRWWTRSLRLPRRAHGSRCWHPWCAGARAPQQKEFEAARQCRLCPRAGGWQYV